MSKALGWDGSTKQKSMTTEAAVHFLFQTKSQCFCYPWPFHNLDLYTLQCALCTQSTLGLLYCTLGLLYYYYYYWISYFVYYIIFVLPQIMIFFFFLCSNLTSCFHTKPTSWWLCLHTECTHVGPVLIFTSSSQCETFFLLLEHFTVVQQSKFLLPSPMMVSCWLSFYASV